MLDITFNVIQDLTPTHWIAISALIVSLVSLTFSTLAYFRDRPNLKIEAKRYFSDETPGYIEIKAVNAGRRPNYLVMLWGSEGDGPRSGSYLDYGGPGIKLNEYEFKTFKVTHLPRGENQYSATAMSDDEFIEFDQMWIEDSLGKNHKVPKMNALLRELRVDYKEWCEKTGYWKR
jgi:hypothetical protein